MDTILEEFSKKWHSNQKEHFKKNWNEKWKTFFHEMNLIWIDWFLEKVLELEQNKFENVNYTFWKLEKILQMCDFLRWLQLQKPSQDTEQIIISIIVSWAEAFYRLNKTKEAVSENLVTGFFNFVKEEIEYKIRSHYPSSSPYEESFEAIKTLYLIRNDYIHNANFLGTFFSSDWIITHGGVFHFAKKEDKSKLILVHSEFTLSYDKFIEIFKKAFWKNIIQYTK